MRSFVLHAPPRKLLDSRFDVGGVTDRKISIFPIGRLSHRYVP